MDAATHARRAGQLVVERTSEPQGLLRWRRAGYAVYRLDAEGNRHEVLHGTFRSSDEALRAAREKLSGEAPPE